MSAEAVTNRTLDERSSKPRSSDLLDVLTDIENRYPVIEWTVANIPVWPLLRLRWFFRQWHRFYTSSGPAASAVSMHRAGEMLTGPLRAFASGARYRGERRPRSDVVFLSDGVSFARLGEHSVERFCEPLIQVAADLHKTAEFWVPSHAYERTYLTAPRFVQWRIDAANVQGALRGRLSPPSVNLPGHSEVVEWLTRQGWSADELRLPQIISLGSRLRVIANAYKSMLRRVRPSVGFIVSYYGLEGMAFVLACRESGVLSVDLQHGVQGELHPAYGSWPQPSKQAFSLLPDRFWVWSDWEADVISRWSRTTSHAPVVGGNPWNVVWNGSYSLPGIEDALKRAEAMKARARNAPVILVTLQYGFVPSEQLEPLLRLIALTGEEFVYWVRLHPCMLERREEIRSMLCSASRSVELDDATDVPLPALLPHANVHLTHSSSVVIEAAQFGVPSVITTKFGEELFAPLYEARVAQTEAGDAAALYRTLRKVTQEQGRSLISSATNLETAFKELLEVAGRR